MRRCMVMLTLLLGCRSQALPEPPQDGDATEPSAPAPRYEAPSPLTRSAFEGVKLREGGHHHHHGAKAKDAPKEAK